MCRCAVLKSRERPDNQAAEHVQTATVVGMQLGCTCPAVVWCQLSDDSQVTMQPCCRILGMLINPSGLTQDRDASLAPGPATRGRLLRPSLRSCGPRDEASQASQLRGPLQWLASGLGSRPDRRALHALAAGSRTDPS